MILNVTQRAKHKWRRRLEDRTASRLGPGSEEVSNPHTHWHTDTHSWGRLWWRSPGLNQRSVEDVWGCGNTDFTPLTSPSPFVLSPHPFYFSPSDCGVILQWGNHQPDVWSSSWVILMDSSRAAPPEKKKKKTQCNINPVSPCGGGAWGEDMPM